MTNKTNKPSIRLIEESGNEPFSIEEIKKYLKVLASTEEELLIHLGKAARQYAEKYTTMSLIRKVWEISYLEYAPQVVYLPYHPIRSIESVQLFYRDNEEVTLDPEEYLLEENGEHLLFKEIQTANLIVIRYHAGYDNAEQDYPPEALRTGMLQHTGILYRNRTAKKAELMSIARRLYFPYKSVHL